MFNTNTIECHSCGYSISECPKCSVSLSAGFLKSFKNTDEYQTLREQIRQSYEDEARVKIKNLENIAEERKARVLELEKQELESLRIKREQEEKERTWNLTLQREIEKAKDVAIRETEEKVQFESNLKVAEMKNKLSSMEKQIDDLKRKSQQGSQQTQGEVLEETIQEILTAEFGRTDIIEPVPKGVKGADILQRVHSNSGQMAGTIIWEMKRTMHWKDDYISKIKQDQREAGANIAVIVTQTMPKGVLRSRYIDGVWVVDFQNYLSLAVAFRQNILSYHQALTSATNRGDTMAVLYDYITGKEFVSSVEATLTILLEAQDTFEKEKRAITKLWSVRELQLKKAQGHMIALFGGCRGIVGDALPTINILELPNLLIE